MNTDNQADHQVESPLIEPPRQAHNFAAGEVESLEEMPVAPGKRGGTREKNAWAVADRAFGLRAVNAFVLAGENALLELAKGRGGNHRSMEDEA